MIGFARFPVKWLDNAVYSSLSPMAWFAIMVGSLWSCKEESDGEIPFNDWVALFPTEDDAFEALGELVDSDIVTKIYFRNTRKLRAVQIQNWKQIQGAKATREAKKKERERASVGMAKSRENHRNNKIPPIHKGG